MLANMIGEFDAADRAHHNVRDHGFRIEPFSQPDGGLGAVGRLCLVAGRVQDLDEAVGDANVVVYNQDAKVLMSIRHDYPG
jgi:hypothetical protein